MVGLHIHSTDRAPPAVGAQDGVGAFDAERMAAGDIDGILGLVHANRAHHELPEFFDLRVFHSVLVFLVCSLHNVISVF